MRCLKNAILLTNLILFLWLAEPICGQSPVKVAMVRSWNTETLAVLDELNNNWGAYGDVELVIDTSLRDVSNFTYTDLVNTGADVLWLSSPCGGWHDYTPAEIDAIQQYLNEGHSIFGTYLVMQYSAIDNRSLAPIFGLRDDLPYNTTWVSAERSFDIEIEYPIFRNIPGPYNSDGNPGAQVPSSDDSWDTGDWGDALLLAQTTDNRGIITWYETPSYHAIYVSEMVEYNGNEEDTQFIYNALTLPGPDVPKHLLLYSDLDNYAQDVVSKIENTGRLDGVLDVYNARYKNPSLNTLKYYDSILVYSHYSFDDPDLVGDNLADYVDGGGGVVEMIFANGRSPYNVEGRWTTDAYHPILSGSDSSDSHLTLSTIYETNHPVLDDVSVFDGGSSSWYGTGGLNPQAALIADWSNGEPLIAEMHKFVGRVIALNFLPPSSDVQSGLWNPDTDGAVMMANALNHVGRGMLSTTFAGGNANHGAMFDLTGIHSIEITGFDYQAEDSLLPDTPQTIEVYYVTSRTSYLGNETDPSAWTLLGRQDVLAADAPMPTHVDIGGLSITPGETIGIYLTTNGSSPIEYTNGVAQYSNSDLIFDSGVGKQYPFGTTNLDRIWNGNIYYDVRNGPVSEYFTTTGNSSITNVLQGHNINRSWANVDEEYGTVVLDTVRTINAYAGTHGSEYSLDGTPTGTIYQETVDGTFYGATTDGTYIYAWNFERSAAYRFDLDWENPVELFNLQDDGITRVGMTYDPASHTLWLAGWSGDLIENRSMSGTLLDSFTIAHNTNTALAMDPQDGTLWLFDRSTYTTSPTFEQYSKSGILLNSVIHPSLISQNTLSGEFAFNSRNRADQTGDNCVTLEDLLVFCSQWLLSENPIECTLTADLAGNDCKVDMADYAFFASNMLLCGSPLYKYDFYVDSNQGSDAYPGTIDQPFKTITHALYVAGENKEIKVLPGTYDAANGEVFPLVMMPGQSLLGDPANKGDAVTPTIIAGRGSHTIGIIDYATILGAEGSKITGFVIGAETYANHHAAIVADGANMQIFNNTFVNDVDLGVYMANDSTSIVEQNIFNTDSVGVEVTNCPNMPVIKKNSFLTGSMPLFVADSTANPLIQDNLIVGTGAHGIYVSYGTPRIENNVFDRPTGYLTAAIQCVTASARPIVRGNAFNCSNAIGILSGDPDLGTDLISDPGLNDFYAVSGACVVHNGAADVSSVGNIWPISIPLFGTHILHNSTGDLIWWQQLDSGTVTIAHGQGYDFSEGTLGDVSHGDFYYYYTAGSPSTYEFFANNVGQQGLLDVAVGSDLNRVQIPTSGYNRFGEPVVKGDSYVSKAQTGEDNCYIIFSVNGVTSSEVGISYIYVKAY